MHGGISGFSVPTPTITGSSESFIPSLSDFTSHASPIGFLSSEIWRKQIVRAKDEMKELVRLVHKDEEEKHDILFWLEKTPEERISAVQVLREQSIVYLNMRTSYDASRRRLRRVYRVVKQA